MEQKAAKFTSLNQEADFDTAGHMPGHQGGQMAAKVSVLICESFHQHMIFSIY